MTRRLLASAQRAPHIVLNNGQPADRVRKGPAIRGTRPSLYYDLKQRANISQANISQLSITCISLCVSKASVHIYTKTLRGPIPNGAICRIYPLSIPQVRLNAGCSSHMIPRANDVIPADLLARARARAGWIDYCTGTLPKLPVRHRNAWFVYRTGTLPIVLEHSCLTHQSISVSGQVHAWADLARADPPAAASIGTVFRRTAQRSTVRTGTLPKLPVRHSNIERQINSLTNTRTNFTIVLKINPIPHTIHIVLLPNSTVFLISPYSVLVPSKGRCWCLKRRSVYVKVQGVFPQLGYKYIISQPIRSCVHKSLTVRLQSSTG